MKRNSHSAMTICSRSVNCRGIGTRSITTRTMAGCNTCPGFTGFNPWRRQKVSDQVLLRDSIPYNLEIKKGRNSQIYPILEAEFFSRKLSDLSGILSRTQSPGGRAIDTTHYSHCYSKIIQSHFLVPSGRSVRLPSCHLLLKIFNFAFSQEDCTRRQ